MNKHTPVLLNEVLEYLIRRADIFVIDATLNGGGHTAAMLDRHPSLNLLGIEFDPDIVQRFHRAHPELVQRATIVNDSYVRLKEIVQEHDFRPDAILFDLGVSSWHYESGRGFSFQREDELLDMRFNPIQQTLTAADVINTYSRGDLAQLIADFGEERFAESIAEEVVQRRRESPLQTVRDLVAAIQAAVPGWYTTRKIHHATKTFQALRIEVNDELNAVEQGIRAAIDVLRPGGRLAVIAFHGLEDRIVREIFKEKAREGVIRWVKRDTIRPTWAEMRENPRSRSAKMKIVEKGGEGNALPE